MRKIAALIDFTPTCDITINYTIQVATTLGLDVVLVNVAEDENSKKEAQEKLTPYLDSLAQHSIASSSHIEIGAFDAIIDGTIQILDPELVIAGTHGIQGLKQTLFGAHILKLAQAISRPVLVVQDQSKTPGAGIKRVLFSIGPHEDFEKEIDFVADFVQGLGAKVLIYTITKSVQDITDELTHNYTYAKKVFAEKDIEFEHCIEESQDFSLGYSRQTIAYMENNPFDLVVMASDSSERYRAFSKTDKENLLLNTLAVPVLCV